VPYHYKHAMEESNSKPDIEELTPSMYALSSNAYAPGSVSALSKRIYTRAKWLSAIERSGQLGKTVLMQLAVYCDLDPRVKNAITQRVLSFISGPNMPTLHEITEFILKEASEVEKQLGIYVSRELAVKAASGTNRLYEQIVNGTHAISAEIKELLCDDCQFVRCMHPKCGKERPHRMDAPTLRSTPSAKIGIPSTEQINTKSYNTLYQELQRGNHKAFVLTSEFWRRLQTGDLTEPIDYLRLISNIDTPKEWIAAFKQLHLWYRSRQSHLELLKQKTTQEKPSAQTTSPPPAMPIPQDEDSITQPEIPRSKYPSRLPPKKVSPPKAKGIVSSKSRSGPVIDINSLVIERPKK
jgi:hypothetical protein